MAMTYVHYGPYESISPDTASPGLLFLKHFLPALECLEPIKPHPVSPFVARDAVWVMNSNIPASKSQVLPMLELRSKHASRFHHDVHIAWDIDLGRVAEHDAQALAPENIAGRKMLEAQGRPREAGPGSSGSAYGISYNTAEEEDGGTGSTPPLRRTVMYEATSGTVFRRDPEQFEVRMEEFNVVELRGEEGAPFGFRVVGLRGFMDARPVMERAGELQAQFAEGAA